MSLSNSTPDLYEVKLKEIALNPKKAQKALEVATLNAPVGIKTLCGETFGADEILSAKYANAALYCFNTNKVIDAFATLGSNESWLSYLSSQKVIDALHDSKGDWSNYVKSAVIHAQFKTDHKLCGMNMISTGNIPVAAGLSSSSAIVVAVMEALVALNCLNLTEREFIDLCGEGEWFVGSRGGSGDHAAMKCGKKMLLCI